MTKILSVGDEEIYISCEEQYPKWRRAIFIVSKLSES